MGDACGASTHARRGRASQPGAEPGPRPGRPAASSVALLWETVSGRLVGTAEGHTHTIYGAAFSPDGHRIITASGDRTARVWDGHNGKLLFTLEGHTEDVFDAAFSPDGARAATASEDGTAKLWDVHLETRSPDEIDALVRCRVPYRLEDERLLHGCVLPQLVMISNEGETRLLGFEAAPGLRQVVRGSAAARSLQQQAGQLNDVVRAFVL